MFKKLINNSLASLAIGAGLLAFGGTAMAETCGTSQVMTLNAGQTIDAGTVTVENDVDNLYVTFTATAPWWLSETHLHVANTLAGIPTNRKGNPKIGNFEYQVAYDPLVSEYTYTIAKADLGLVDGNNSLVVAAHAVVVQLDANGYVTDSETGWADGDTFTDKGSWATYFAYTWQECDTITPPAVSGTETAFALGSGYETCFLDIDDDSDGNGDFNRWGWSNGAIGFGTYTWDIYAGAGQCDLTKGTLVGNLTIDYDGSTATVTFTMTATDSTTLTPYNLVETHLYVGSEPLARDNGSYTVSPGQYPTIHEGLNGATSDTYTITGLSGDIHVVAHATVSGFPSE